MYTQLARICWGRSTSCSIYGFVFQVISEKTLCSKNFTKNLREIFIWNNRNYNSYKFSYKFIFISFLSFHRNQKQESNFQQVVGLVTRNNFGFFYSESRSTSEIYRIQLTFIKGFSYMLFLFVLYSHAEK